jgi:integrase
VRDGRVFQRHTTSCPTDDSGRPLPHKCRGKWSYVVDSGRRSDGRRRQLSRGGYPTKAAARAALAQLLQEIGAGAADESHHLTVAEFLEQWLAGKRALRPSTRKSYREHVDQHLLPHLGHYRLRELRASHIDRLLDAVSSKRGGQLSAGSQRRIHSTLRTALNAAVRQRLIPYNPASAVELPPVDQAPTAVWTREQVATFLAAVRDDPFYPLFHVVVVTGLRRGEAIGLRWSDLDLDHGILRVRQQVVQLGGKLHLGPPKTKAGVRAVAVDALTVQLLRTHRTAQETSRELWGEAWQGGDLVFARENGALLSPELVSRRFRLLSRAAGLPVIRFHDLRHTSASLALAAGVAMKVVSDRLGHSTTAITADLYTHVVPVVAQDAADAIAALVWPAGERAVSNPSGTPVENKEEK